VVTSFTAPTAATLGDAIAVTAAVKNQGTAKAGAFRAGFYFGVTPLKSDQDVFSGASCALDQGLAAGESAPCAAKITLPSTLKPGTYWLRAVADDLNAVAVPDRGGCWRSADSGPITLQAPAPAAVATPSFDAAGIVNAASQQGGAVAPGEMFDLAGDNLGSAAQISATRVLFDGVTAPLVSVSAKKVRGMVPFGVTPGGDTQVQVESNGVKSAAVAVAVAPSAPGIFTGILNQDGTRNSADAPASPLSVVSLLVTGAGQTDPASVDGQVSADGSGSLLLPVSATVGGLDARIVAAGPAAGMVSGIVRIHVEIPADAATDPAAPVIVTVGTAGSAPAGVAVGTAVTTN
jgi:uncharacterized protein (TIGR03437 family)